jgi:hypothetical protein
MTIASRYSHPGAAIYGETSYTQFAAPGAQIGLAFARTHDAGEATASKRATKIEQCGAA